MNDPQPHAHLPKAVMLRILQDYLEPWGTSAWYPATPPTDQSIRRIESELGVHLPPLLIEIAKSCPSYGGWFGSVGEDFDSGNHILSINRAFREEGLPANFRMFNHGHDGECDGWECDAEPVASERPIVWLTLECSGQKVLQRSVVAQSFAEYIDAFVRSHAPRDVKKYLADEAR